MVILYCQRCRGLVRLIETKRFCSCGQCSGYNEDGIHYYKGPGIRLSIPDFDGKTLQEIVAMKTFSGLVITGSNPKWVKQ